MKNSASLVLSDRQTLHCAGDWTQQGVQSLENLLAHIQLPHASSITIDSECLKVLDSTGALLLIKLEEYLEKKGFKVQLTGLSQENQNIVALVKAQGDCRVTSSLAKISFLESIGISTIRGLDELNRFLSFIGECAVVGFKWLKRPWQIRWPEIASGIQITGFGGLPIVGLLAFLVGIVLAYQMAIQLTNYGAGIYVVDLMGVAMFREFGPLMTAIIIAGRTGSAYTAQLGTMILNEEVDALRTLGLSPIELLVLPKVVALLIALPLLSVFADIFGVFGGMIMAKGMLGIEFTDFLQRFSSVIPLRTFCIGMIKTPIFAGLISTIGCFQGFEVQGGADSVGRKTTTSVVQAIFMIIVADAGFSVLFSMLDI